MISQKCHINKKQNIKKNCIFTFYNKIKNFTVLNTQAISNKLYVMIYFKPPQDCYLIKRARN